MRILVLGGTGFIGVHVLRHLSDMGHEVAVLHRGQTRAELPDRVESILGDRSSLANKANLFRELAPEVAVDMTPVTQEDAQAVMTAFAGIARRVVAVSSIDVYRAYNRCRQLESGPPDPVPLSEDAPLREKLYPYRGDRPRSEDDPDRWMDNYDKILVERVFMADPDMPGTILRLPMVYGPGDRQHRLFTYIKRMDDNCPAILLQESVARWRGSRGYVEDVAAAIALAANDERASGCIYNVGELEAHYEADWVKRIAEVAGWTGRLVTVRDTLIPAHLYVPWDLNQHWCTNTSKIREELEYTERVPHEEALRRTISWELANPPGKVDPSLFNYEAENQALAKLGSW